MKRSDICKKMLEEQLKLLSERSHCEGLDTSEITELTTSMVSIVKVLSSDNLTDTLSTAFKRELNYE